MASERPVIRFVNMPGGPFLVDEVTARLAVRTRLLVADSPVADDPLERAAPATGAAPTDAVAYSWESR